MVRCCGTYIGSIVNPFSAIISFGGVTNDQKEEAKNHGLSIFSWEEFLITVRFSLQLASLSVLVEVMERSASQQSFF